MYEYCFDVGFTDYDGCDYQEVNVRVTSPVSLNNFSPFREIDLGKIIASCTGCYDSRTVRISNYCYTLLDEKENE